MLVSDKSLEENFCLPPMFLHYVNPLSNHQVAIDGLNKHAKQRNPLNNIYASTTMSDFNMRFTWEQLKFIFQEIRSIEP
jgi:hypothetical protein